jgi:spore germination protein YaaH
MASVTLLALVWATATTHAVPAARAAQPSRSSSPAAVTDPAPAQLPNALAAALAPPTPPLPPAVGRPAPAPPNVSAVVLRPHEVFGFAPYWTLPSAGGFDVADLTTVAYFGVDAAPDGTLVRSGPGWNGYASQALVDLISRAHHAGDRVVLTVESFDPATLHRLASDPAADAHLADEIIGAVGAKAMDGVNIDFEGTGAADRAGMTRLVGYLSARVRSADPHWQLTVDTYADSATDPGGFFDVRSMAGAVDAFFVMAYDMYRPGIASPNAPLAGGPPSDQAAVGGYVSAVPARKVILGIPFYGYSWQTASDAPRAQAVSGPSPVSYAQVVATPEPVYWDSDASVPWTASQDAAGNWHETYFDDPQSVALKAQLADAAGLLGVGAWALGTDGNDPSMMAAMLGHAAAVKEPAAPAGPPATSATTASPATTTSSTSTTSTTSTTRPPQRAPVPAPITTPTVTLPRKVAP